MSSLESEVSDVTSRVDDQENATSSSELQSQIDELQATIESLCDAISLNYIYSDSATEDLLTDLNSACP